MLQKFSKKNFEIGTEILTDPEEFSYLVRYLHLCIYVFNYSLYFCVCQFYSNKDTSSSLSLKCALRESGCRIGYEPTKNELRLLSAVDIQGHQRGGF